MITEGQIRSSAGVDGSLTSYVGQVLAETAEKYELPAEDLHSWARTTFGLGHAADEGAQRTEGMPNSVLHRLQDRYLLKVQRESNVLRFRVLHDRLIAPLERLNIRPDLTCPVQKSLCWPQSARGVKETSPALNDMLGELSQPNMKLISACLRKLNRLSVTSPMQMAHSRRRRTITARLRRFLRWCKTPVRSACCLRPEVGPRWFRITGAKR